MPWPQLHGRLLVLPLNHLVVLPVLQVGGQLRVLSLLCPLPGSVALEEGGAGIRLRGRQALLPGCGWGREAWPGGASPTPAGSGFLRLRNSFKSPEGAALPRLPSHRAQVWEGVGRGLRGPLAHPVDLLTCWSVFMSEAPASTM